MQQPNDLRKRLSFTEKKISWLFMIILLWLEKKKIFSGQLALISPRKQHTLTKGAIFSAISIYFGPRQKACGMISPNTITRIVENMTAR